VVSCPIDGGDLPCPATPVQARLTVVDATTGAVIVTAVDTDRQGHFTTDVPAGHYQVRPVLVAGRAARRPTTTAVTVTAGRYTVITLRLDTGLPVA